MSEYSMQTTGREAYRQAAFDVTGALVGQSVHESQFSPKWLQFCDRLLALNGEQFSVNLTGPLSHISLRFTSAAGAALGTFSARGHLSNSLLLLSGREPDADSELMQMFHESVLHTVAMRRLTPNPAPFQQLFELEERPLACVVSWGNPNISDEDHGVIRELSLHVAGAFFKRCAGPLPEE